MKWKAGREGGVWGVKKEICLQYLNLISFEIWGLIKQKQVKRSEGDLGGDTEDLKNEKKKVESFTLPPPSNTS